jgi:hypothetical protein
MPYVGFKLTIQVLGLVKTIKALDCKVTVIDL